MKKGYEFYLVETKVQIVVEDDRFKFVERFRVLFLVFDIPDLESRILLEIDGNNYVAFQQLLIKLALLYLLQFLNRVIHV